jgi:DNA-binding PadR family transcriptional regulator
MNTNSTLELALVGLLCQKPQSGYDLRKTFGTTAMRHFSDSPGSIYPALRRLEARGWIAAQLKSADEADNSRGRQVFHLTTAGQTVLVKWLEQPLTREDVVWRMQEVMLRFAFMDGNVPRSTAIRFLDEFEQALGAYVADLRIDHERMISKMPVHTGLLAFQSGIEGMEAQLGWARRARAQLAEEER